VSQELPWVNVLVYGRSGTGKTTFAGTLRNFLVETDSKQDQVLFIDVSEDGTPSIRDVKGGMAFDAEDWADLEGIYWFLKEEEHPFGALVIDTITQMQNVAMAQAKVRANKQPDEAMSRQSWGYLSGMLAPLLLDFKDLPMHTCFIAQDRRQELDIEDEDEDEILPEMGPAVIPSIAKTVNAMVGVIGQTYVKRVHKTKGGRVTKRDVFRMRLGPHPFYLTKIRSPKSFKTPDSIINPSFSKIAKIMRGESR
jgi:hypothetical protein